MNLTIYKILNNGSILETVKQTEQEFLETECCNDTKYLNKVIKSINKKGYFVEPECETEIDGTYVEHDTFIVDSSNDNVQESMNRFYSKLSF